MQNHKHWYPIVALGQKLDGVERLFEPARRRTRRLYYHPTFQKLEGYHFGIMCCAIISAAVLVVNTTLTIWGYKHYGVADGLGTIKEGSCSQTKSLATQMHLVINILSSLLLGASNYSMQCLSAPTRYDIDKSHAQRIWLSVGTSSIRNLTRISRPRAMLWLLVAISSVPLHLLYNTAVFTTLYARGYNAFLVTPPFLAGANFDVGIRTSDSTYGNYSVALPEVNVTALNARAQYLRDQQHSLSRLANEDCLRMYSTGPASNHGDVLVVVRENDVYPNQSGAWDNRPSPILAVWPFIEPSFLSQNSGVIPWYCSDNSVLQGGNCSAHLKDSVAWNCMNVQISNIGHHTDCNSYDLITHADRWQMFGRQVDHCFGVPVEEHCTIQFSAPIMVIVIVCNSCKMFIMGFIAWKRPLEPLATVGDAVASFLKTPDLTTQGNCMLQKSHFKKENPNVIFRSLKEVGASENHDRTTSQRCLCRTRSHEFGPSATPYSDLSDFVGRAYQGRVHQILGRAQQQQLHTGGHNCCDISDCDTSDPWDGRPSAYAIRNPRWFKATSQLRGLLLVFLCLNLGSLIANFITKGLQSTSLTNSSISHLWGLGFGKVTAETIINFDLPSNDLMLTILIANSPQILLSCLYLSINGLLTDMLLADEWSKFAHQRAYLRVTSPQGKQRSTYRLQIPYKYGIPLLTVFGCLHWLVSQSLFLARVNVYDINDALDESESISTCGYSIMAVVLVLILGAIILIVFIAVSFRKYKLGMPLAGSCSAAISAACHPPKLDIQAAHKPVRWGAIPNETQHRSGRHVGHCTITSFEVDSPVEGSVYAGWKDGRYEG